MEHVKLAMSRTNNIVGFANVLSLFGIISIDYHEETINDVSTGAAVEEIYVIEFDTDKETIEQLVELCELEKIGEYYVM